MRFRKTLPSDQVLELVASSSGAQDIFDFPFGLAINKFWDRFPVFTTIHGGFFVWGEQQGMEDVMDFPRWGKLELE
jgi:hypothetical protein